MLYAVPFHDGLRIADVSMEKPDRAVHAWLCSILHCKVRGNGLWRERELLIVPAAVASTCCRWVQ